MNSASLRYKLSGNHRVLNYDSSDYFDNLNSETPERNYVPQNSLTFSRSRNPLTYTPGPRGVKFNPLPPPSSHPGKQYTSQGSRNTENTEDSSASLNPYYRPTSAFGNPSSPRPPPRNDSQGLELPTRTPPSTTSTPKEESALPGPAAAGIGYIANSAISGVLDQQKIDNQLPSGQAVGQPGVLNPDFYDSPAPQGQINAREREAQEKSKQISAEGTVGNILIGAAGIGLALL